MQVRGGVIGDSDLAQRTCSKAVLENMQVVDSNASANSEYLERKPNNAQVRRYFDPGDTYLLAMATAAKVQYLVTGDKSGLLAIKQHGGTQLVTVRQMVATLKLR